MIPRAPGRRKSKTGADRVPNQASSTARSFKRTRSDHATETAEDYAEVIADLIDETGEARLVDIARAVGISHVTANRTLRRLQRDGLVQTRPYRSIFLTDEGRALADAARRRHALVLDFLTALGVPRQQAEVDAEGIEHHASDATLKAMARFIKRTRTASKRKPARRR
ncbi:MAG: manganese-binding transcriptional regulator MntR [Planctomycetes bacterium]|nr:manganese-binding transcriptional regulator MntR [Planctomycetota bacterium]